MDNVITAKLIRGKKYSFWDVKNNRYEVFDRSVPREVSVHLADDLEELFDVVTTTDGDEIEKPHFEINRRAQRAEPGEGGERRQRLRLTTMEPKESKVKPPPVRKAPPGMPGRRG